MTESRAALASVGRGDGLGGRSGSGRVVRLGKGGPPAAGSETRRDMNTWSQRTTTAAEPSEAMA